ncbi:MAG: 2-C-methyl-D-erythritol 2,4-cyclodiphosphate synthase [Fidelibacterota bacterium]|nr:MAG: 2-C-methyl-D-erythritol 2,4-cyclodiphosphate synthase [Candidatus Neomarinimicrobiota bacterium]
MIKTGLGLDVHGFVAGSRITLGGVNIPCKKSISGHSDGDVVIHAVVDALLGAVAAGDIGAHFPSSDPRWKDADSRVFLQRAREIVTEADGRISNVDCTVILQEPAIAPYITEMRRNVAEVLEVETGRVSIKATTTDHLGFTGRGEGIAALAVATVTMVKK